MGYDIAEITRRLDEIVEPFLSRDENGGFREEFGWMRRTREDNHWPDIDYDLGWFEWFLLGEIPPQYLSTTSSSLFLITKPLENALDIGKGFYINGKYVGIDLDTTLEWFEREVRGMKKRIQR